MRRPMWKERVERSSEVSNDGRGHMREGRTGVPY